MSASRNTTHRKTIARTLTQQADIPYSRARRLVDLAAEQNLLPAALTASGVTAAVSMLASERVMSMLLSSPVTPPNTKTQAETAFRARLTAFKMSTEEQDVLLASLDNPTARILCTGKTFTGKTTTQYAIVEYLRDIGLAVASVEDPIEQTLPGIHQIETMRAQTLDEAVTSLTEYDQQWDVTNIAELRTEAAIRTFLLGPGIRIASIHAGSANQTRNRFTNVGVTADLFDHCLDLMIEHHAFKPDCHHLPPAQTLDTEQVQKLRNLLPAADLSAPVPMRRPCAECTTAGSPTREYVRTVVTPGTSVSPQGGSKAAHAAWELVSDGRMTVDQFLDMFAN